MTPDQFISTMHRQRADQMAMRLATADLANVLAPEAKAGWLQALQARTATLRALAPTVPQDQAQGLLDTATALDFLHRSLARPAEPASQTGV